MRLNEDLQTIRDLIDRCAEAQPDRAFLLSPETGRELTFKALQQQLRHLRGRFQGMGLAHGDKIAFLMDNGLFTAQLFLGTMYGGFVAVPLNARAGVSQLSYTLENCDAKIVFVGRHYAALLKDVLEHVRRPLEVVSVDEDAEPVAGEAPDMGAPPLPVQKASESWQLLPLSARSSEALERATDRLAEHFATHPELDLADVAFTLQQERKPFAERRILAVRSRDEAIELLRTRARDRVFTASSEGPDRPVAFLFPGQAAQYVNMGLELYRAEKGFRENVDACSEFLAPHLGFDLRQLLYPGDELPDALERLSQTAVTQPAMFVVEYATARLWMDAGVVPDAMIGHSIGEYVAACLAGVFSLDDALTLVAGRGRLMQSMPRGSMLAVRLEEASLRQRLGSSLDLAVVNGPMGCVAAGPTDAILELQASLAENSIESRLLATSHGFHSRMMESALEPFRDLFRNIKLSPAKIPFLSNVTGAWITAAQATDPGYWASQLRQTVRFAEGVGKLLKTPRRILLEVGPGHTLTALARQQSAKALDQIFLSSFDKAKGRVTEMCEARTTLGRLWAAGVSVDWHAASAGAMRRRVSPSTYPFERERYWIEPAQSAPDESLAVAPQSSFRTQGQGSDQAEASEQPARADTPQETRDARTDLQKKIAAVWQEILGFEDIGIDDDFFALGGDSLLAVQLMFRLRQVFSGADLPLSALLERPTVARLADWIQSQQHQKFESLTLIRPENGTQISAPLSFVQLGLWFLSRMEGASAAYNLPFNVRLKGRLNRDALLRALDRIVARHAALRTTFALADGEPVQRIAKPEESGFHLMEHDLRGQSHSEAELDRMATEEMRTAFDLETGPLVRGRLVQTSEDDYALLITMHHIVSDGRSGWVLGRELSALYTAFSLCQPDPLPELKIQYADYAVWNRERIQGGTFEGLAEYWKNNLAGAPTLIELPTDHPRPAVEDHTGAFIQLTLDEPLTARLKELSRRNSTTLFMTLLAAWAALLARWSGQQDLLIGTPVANREQIEIQDLIGFFANTLVLHLDLSGSPSVAELLKRTRAQVLAAQQHQDLPFKQVVELVQPVRSLAYNPLFQVMFSWQNNDLTLALPQLEAQPLHSVTYGTSKFDLTLVLREEEDRIAGGIEYATSLFEQATIARCVEYLRVLLEAMVADDTLTVDRLPLLSASERNQLLYAWNVTQAVSPADRCVHELFEAQAAKTPDVIALVFEGRQLSYTELNARANQLAHHLIATGLKPEGRVAIALERSAEMVVAMLAILKAGGAFVPIDPAYPAERISFMIEDSAPDILLTQRAVLPLLGHLPDKLPIFTLDDSTPPWAALPTTNLDPASVGLASANLAYVIYTSGSTGRPKGVLIEHGPLAQHCAECQEFYGLTQEDRVLQFASPSFDAAIEQILPPLLSGARVVLRDVQLWTSSEFQQKLGELGLTVIDLPPAVWQQLAEQWVNAVEPVSVHAVRLVIIGGDAMSVQTLRLWQQTAFNSVRLLNAYGPTETVITATSFEIPASVSGQERFERLPIGRKRGARRLYVRDRWGQLAPVGATGELLIGGTALARGYHNRADLTAEKFIADPFISNAGDRVYRTGDLARYLPDGNIEFLGRVDQQVKIRGFRIELGEIEARLQKHAAIRGAVVLLREDVAGDKRLVAYYVALTHEDIDQEKLRSYLAAGLPEYMVPAAYVRLDALPQTTNGKLDRKALPAPDDEAYARATYEAPQGEIETTLAAIWAEMLGLEQISRNDNFFNLGGHSLLALRVISEINKTLQLHLNVPAFFLNPTIERLARELDHSHYVRTEPRVVTLRKGHAGLPVYLMGARPDEYQRFCRKFCSWLNPAEKIEQAYAANK